MNEYRCKFCHKLLFKIIRKEGIAVEQPPETNVVITNHVAECKCSKCKKVNVFDLNKQEHHRVPRR